MTDIFNSASGKHLDSEILEMLNNTVEVRQVFADKAKSYYQDCKNKLSRAKIRRKHYEKTGRLLPEVTDKD